MSISTEKSRPNSFEAGQPLELCAIPLRPGMGPTITVGGKTFRGILGAMETPVDADRYLRYQVNVPRSEVAALTQLLAERDPTADGNREGLFRFHRAAMVRNNEGGVFPIDRDRTQLDVNVFDDSKWAMLCSVTPLRDDMTMRADIATAMLVAFPVRARNQGYLFSPESKRVAKRMQANELSLVEPADHPEVAPAVGRLLRNFVGSDANRRALGKALGIETHRVVPLVLGASDAERADLAFQAFATGVAFQARFATFAGRAKGAAADDVRTMATHPSTASIVSPVVADLPPRSASTGLEFSL